MGAFNTVRSEQRCASCGQLSAFQIQYKYGELWQYEYQIGDSIAWSTKYKRSDVGKSGRPQVVVEGIAEHCPLCRAEGGEFEVWFANDQIIEVRPLTDPEKFIDNNFIVPNSH
ncbi:hypothetical protein V5E97_22380 [Singulisphaera sp. Ch08]|uniref:Uncharacterized protein n=1 Tax=Singulisphaera sp. Ch08 TaxID=3120278 RepID=A0AAU7C7Z9_9BACT